MRSSPDSERIAPEFNETRPIQTMGLPAGTKFRPDPTVEPIAGEMLFLGGFRKSGTTSIYDWLVQQEVAWGPGNYKEPQFFCGAKTDADGVAWYRRLYRSAPDNVPLLDGSTLMVGGGADFITALRYFPKVKLVVVLRDPVRRAYSAYWHMRAKGKSVEARTFSEIVSQLPTEASSEALFHLEGRLNEQAAHTGLVDGTYMDVDYLRGRMGVSAPDFVAKDRLWFFRYFGESAFSYVLGRLELPSQVEMHLCVFEELARSESARNALLDFVVPGLAPRVAVPELPRSNTSSANTHDGLLRRARGSRILKMSMDALPKQVKQFAQARLRRAIPELDESERRSARRILQNEYEHWRSAGVDVDRLWA